MLMGSGFKEIEKIGFSVLRYSYLIFLLFSEQLFSGHAENKGVIGKILAVNGE